MKDLLASLFSSAGFMPHGHCYLWTPGIVWLHVVSDALIALSYYSIPITLAWFVRRRRDIDFRWMFLAFAAFILACGTTHLMEIWNVWHGSYWLAGTFKAITAAASIPTAILLTRLMPQALALPSPTALRQANDGLREEVAARREAEEKLRDTNTLLETRVAERTAELLAANAELRRQIAERKMAEEALREGEERFRTMANSIPQLAWMAAADGSVVWYNERWYEYTGTTPAEMQGWGWQKVHDPAVLPLVVERWAEALTTGQPFEMEFPLRGADGRFRIFLTRVQPLRDSEGRVAQWFGTNTDVEIMKQAEAALRASEESFRFLDDLAEATRPLAEPAQIMAVTAQKLGGHLRASRCAYADVEEDGERFTILHDFTDGCASTVGSYQLSLFGSRAVATLHAGQTLIIRDVATELRPGDGAETFRAIGIQAIITCPLVKDGRLRAMMAVHHTTPRDWQPAEIAMVEEVVERCWATIERRNAEEQVHRLNAELELRVTERTAQLEEANKELEAFSYSVSHDLRAPLRAVDGFSQAVLEDYGGLLPEEGHRYLATIRGGAQKMGVLIDDLLTFSRLSRLPLTRQTVDAARQVQDTLDELKPGQNGRELEVRLGELPPYEGDPVLMKQVWVNLISNALKYSGKREHAVVEIGATQGRGAVVYFVRDNGTGFDMRYAGKLFGVFQRLHRQEDFEGTGVGLAIVQRIIHRHGGRVWAESIPDQGATFSFTLADAAPDERTPPPGPAPSPIPPTPARRPQS